MRAVLAALGVFAASGLAKESRNEPPDVEFACFPLPLRRTHFSAACGTPATKANLKPPFPKDFPPNTAVEFDDGREFPAFKKGARYFSPSRNHIVVYRITQVERAPYRTIQPYISALRRLLAERPKDGRAVQSGRSLPDYPPRNAAHTFEAKITYLDAAWGSGIFYLCQFTQEAGDFANNEKLTYLFQGLSKDGDFYVSADFRITHPKLPAGIDSKPLHGADNDLADSAFLKRQPDESFKPSLRKVREWVGTFKLE